MAAILGGTPSNFTTPRTTPLPVFTCSRGTSRGGAAGLPLADEPSSHAIRHVAQTQTINNPIGNRKSAIGDLLTAYPTSSLPAAPAGTRSRRRTVFERRLVSAS